MVFTPLTSQVLTALDRKSKKKGLTFEDNCVLKYHREHQNDVEYLLKLEDAKEFYEAKQSSNQTISSNRHRSRSPIDRRHQQQAPLHHPLNRNNYEYQSKSLGKINEHNVSNRETNSKNVNANTPINNATGRPTRKCAPKNLSEAKLSSKLQGN